jgi:adenylate kinase
VNGLQTVIFIGPQGSGKGTQADILVAHLRAKDPAAAVFKHDTGARFRDFMGADGTYAAELVRASVNRGELQPSFLPIHLWAKDFIENIKKPETHLVIDGSPRTLLQAHALDEAFAFYSREKVAVVHLTLPADVSVQRMLSRGRPDDTEEAIRRRLELYHKQTAPLLEYFSANSRYEVHEMNGNRSIEDIQADIREKLGIAQRR